MILIVKRKQGRVCAIVIKETGIAAREFTSCSFIHEGRRTNHEAHDLAKYTLGLDEGRHVWLIDPPHYLSIPANIID
jgi:hypothetical protein